MVLNWMIETVVYLYEGYLWTLTFADKRVETWPLMSSPKYTAMLTLSYLTISLYGPRLMKRFPPFDLRLVIVAYNMAMVALNAYISIECFMTALKADYNFLCQPVNYSNDPLEVRIAAALWWFYISKLLEYLDTIFFILRKKFNQVTFLHVYHHSTMFCFCWIGVKWVAGGSAFFAGFVNSFVHVLMYAYYALAAAFPKSDFWWKRYLTVIQLMQFSVAIVLGINALRVNCPFPRWMGYALVAYMISFIILFANFWFHSYSKIGKKSKRELLDDGKPAYYDAVSHRKKLVSFAPCAMILDDCEPRRDENSKKSFHECTNGHVYENGVVDGKNLRQRVK